MKLPNFLNKEKIKKNVLSDGITFGILFVVLVGVLVPSVSFAQQFPSLTSMALGPGAIAANGLSGTGFWEGVAKFVGSFLMTISSLFLTFAGLLLDWVIKLSIIDMAKNIGNPQGLGGSITKAWSTLRDLANMCFIFVLLFAAFKAMFSLSPGSANRTILNIIIVALLINFSLFFSKVVIDASNVVSLGFYKSITNTNIISSGGTTSTEEKTLSAGYMRLLGLQSWFGAKILETPDGTTGDKILLVGVMGSIFFLVTSVIFLITAVMFVARFIILIFLMILSPLAFIAFVIPGQEGQFNKWKDALINQSFFAPIFFALTWVSLKIASSPGFLGTININNLGNDFIQATKAPTSSAIILNYVLVIGFAIAALVISKQIASKTAGFTTIAGGIGSGAAGSAAWLGRTSVGQIGKRFSESAGLQKAAATKTGIPGAAARLALYASKQARSGTFDVRNASIPTGVAGDLVEGTVGRTKVGKKLGLNDVTIPSIGLNTVVRDMDILGKGGTKGFKETREESAKRVREHEAAATSELSLAQAKKAVVEGSSAPVGSPAIGEMEKALAKLSDKETEALVSSNRDLLESQNFANAISVKQLEALNKSDQFSESDKSTLKNKRFSDINAAMAPSGAGASSVRTNIRNLSDTELEMINAEHLENADFVSHLKSSQFESISKSSKFTTNQKDKLRAARRKPLADAIVRRNIADIKKALKALGPKEIASLDMPILKLPTMLDAYSPSLLKRMAPEMNPADVLELRDEIIRVAGTPGASTNVIDLNTWLGKPDGAIFS